MVWEALASYVYPSGVKKKPGSSIIDVSDDSVNTREFFFVLPTFFEKLLEVKDT